MSNEKFGRGRILWGVAVLLGVVAAAITVSVISKQYSRNNSGSQNSVVSRRIVEKVGNLYLLPKNEEPTVAQIQDRSKLEGQPFFDAAQDDDYLLVYTGAKLALIYRDRDNKLVNVGPVNTGASGVVDGGFTH